MAEEEKLKAKVKASKIKTEEARSAMQASKSRSVVLTALMEQKKSGKLSGICGRLVEYLRESATKKVKSPENVPRLFDLVKLSDPKLLTAFYFGLRDTMVAKDLDQATKIAYQQNGKRFRVVTVSGDLIELSGTLSGGGKKVSKGRMGSAVNFDVSQKGLEQLEVALSENSQKLEAIRQNKQELEAKVAGMKTGVSTMEHQLEKAAMEKRMLIDNQKMQLAQLKELQAKLKTSKPDPKKTNDLQHSIDEFQQGFNKASASAEDISKEVQRLHNKIMSIGGSKLKQQQARLESINQLMDEASENKTKINVAIKSAHRNKKKCEDKVNSLEKELKDNEAAIHAIEEELENLESKAAEVLDAHEEAQRKLKDIENDVDVFQTEFAAFEKQENEIKIKELDVKHELEKYETVLKENKSKIKHWKKELTALSLHRIDSSREAPQFPSLEAEETSSIDKEAIMYEITVLEEKLNQSTPNMAVIEDYRKKEELYLSRVGELDKVTESRDEARQQHDTLRKERLDVFMAGFTIITGKLKEMYQMITLGGDAELELVDSLDPFSEGVVFSVRPPKKSWKNISNLSGGEKTLSSLALVFALHHFKPTPLYVMDEIDAALDFKNVSIVANYIKERTKNAQFIIISLRNNMFELADRLVGIYKTDNCTKSVAINPHLITA